MYKQSHVEQTININGWLYIIMPVMVVYSGNKPFTWEVLSKTFKTQLPRTGRPEEGLSFAHGEPPDV